MMPGHCKDVAFKRVEFQLTEEAIRRRLEGERVFTRTEFFILENRGAYAVARVEKKRGIDLFRQVIRAEVLSLPESTAFVRDPQCDVLNPHAMAKKAVQHSRDTVVVQGAFEHISFIKGEKHPLVLRAVDVVPPFPSKTVQLVEDALRVGSIQTPVLVEPVLVDAAKLAAGKEGDIFMFPCEAGKIEVRGKPVVYLDKTPPLRKGARVVLAGCELSKRIFRRTYGCETELVNICPRDLAGQHFEAGKLHIARCCDVHRVKVENGLALVPYGARVEEVACAIKALVEMGPGPGARSQVTTNKPSSRPLPRAPDP